MCGGYGICDLCQYAVVYLVIEQVLIDSLMLKCSWMELGADWLVRMNWRCDMRGVVVGLV